MEFMKQTVKTNLILCFYLIICAHMLSNVSNSTVKWNFDKGGQDWPESCKDGEQAPIDIGKPFEFKSKNLKIFFLFYIFLAKQI